MNEEYKIIYKALLKQLKSYNIYNINHELIEFRIEAILNQA